MSNVTLLDPTNEAKPVRRQLATRPEKISGNVALLDISKRQGNIFLDKLEQAIEQRVSGINIKRYVKPTFSKPAPESLRQEIKENNNFVVVALADWGSCTSCSLHDIVWFEIQGLPSAAIASTEFADAAETQAKALGMANANCLFVNHPIQDASSIELARKADSVVDQVIQSLSEKT